MTRVNGITYKDGVGGGGVYFISCMAVARMITDPRIHNAGAGHVGFSPTRQILIAPSAKRNMRCSASRTKGKPRLTKNRLRRTSASCEYFIVF